MSIRVAVRKLKALFGERCLDDELDRVQYSYDATQMMFPPSVVVFPQTTEEVSEILSIANIHRIPVVPRGWGSGFSGGALNIRGGICLSLEKMDRIVEIDEDNLVAVVEAGVVNYDLQETLRPLGLFFPPDPSSWKFSTIGGNIAENAGGPRAVKYGVTKDWVMGLEVVLPDGSVVNTGSRNVKDVAGYNLTGLIVGSEGTLCVVTKAILKLHPIPPFKATLRVSFGDIGDAASAVSSIIRDKIIPTSVEFIDRMAIDSVREALGVDLPEADAMLVMEVDGEEGAVEDEIRRIKEVCERFKIVEFKVAGDENEAEELWRARRSISPTLRRIADGKLNEDIVVPRARLAEMVKRIYAISEEFKIPIINFGHAGDGNIHVNIMYHTQDEDEAKRANMAMKAVFDACLSLGGSITGEHGVGITKAEYLERQVGARSVELFRALKRAFDPNNILNPGKMGL